MAASFKIELIAPFIDAASETLSTVAFMQIRHKEVSIKQGYEMSGDVSAIVGLSGATTGTCALSMPMALAESAIRGMLVRPDDEALSELEVRDGVGELISRIAGAAKSRLLNTRYKFNTTLPAIILGRKHEVFHRVGACCAVIVFENSRQQHFALEVCISMK